MFRKVSPECAGISSEQVLKFLKLLDDYHFCTHSFIMARGHDVFAEGYYAPYTKDSKQRMYSVSKSFVSMAVGLAEQDGLLTLDDRMMDYFPEYRDGNVNALLENMTIREMLTMQTCMQGIYWFYTGTDDRCEVYFKEFAQRLSGTTWRYDSPGSFMLGVIVEKVTGKPFLEYLKERCLIKAGFSKDSYCLQCPGGHSFGDSGVMCSARDLLSFARFVMDGGEISGVSYINREYVAQATGKQVCNNACGYNNYDTHGYGYQIYKTRNDGFAFCGMGDQFAICDREKDFIFVITSDNQGNTATTPLLLHELYSMIVDQLGEPRKENKETNAELDKYIRGLKLFSLKGNSSPYQDEINGKKFILEQNSMGIEWVRFDFSSDKGVLVYKNKQGQKELPFGLSHNEFSKFPQKDYADLIATVPKKDHQYDCVASADWPEEKKLRIKVQIIDKYLGNLGIVVGFKDDRIGIQMKKNAEAFLDEYDGFANGQQEQD